MTSPPTGAAPLPRKRRGVELVMIVFALLISLGAYIIVGLTMDGRIPPSLLGAGTARRRQSRRRARAMRASGPARGHR
ncbi:MAG: hypothetical protein ACJ72W_05180 [Actinoallomurus sp.]